jgi:hypothetical protein
VFVDASVHNRALSAVTPKSGLDHKLTYGTLV